MSPTKISNKQLWPVDEVARNKCLDAALELVNQEFSETVGPEHTEPSLFHGDAHLLGYYAGGMLMVPFVQWLIQAAKEMGIEELYFLSRDGHIIKRVYEILAPHYEDVPTAHYLLASRRAFNNASIKSDDDILDSLEGAFLTGSPKSILRSRFGVAWSSEREESCVAAGFNSGDDLSDFEEGAAREKLQDFALSQRSAIFHQSQVERDALESYLNTSITGPGKIAIVDIGHSGSLQKSLQRLTGNRTISGFYFLTFNKAAQVHTDAAPVKGWLGEFIDPSSDHSDYCRNIGMFEFLFLNDELSLSHFEKDVAAGHAAPIYVAEPFSDRQTQVAKVHDGIEKFTRDLVGRFSENIVDFSLEKEVATRVMVEFVCRPSQIDAGIVSNVIFFDGYAGEATHYLVHPKRAEALESLTKFGDYIDGSWWKPGAWALLSQDEVSSARVRWLSWLWAGLVGRVIRRFRKIRGLL